MIEFYGLLKQTLSDLKMDKEIDLMYRHISQKRPPIDNMISMMQRYGFIIKDLEQDQFSYKFANGTAMLNHYFIRLAFMDSWIKLLPPEKVDQIFNTIEINLNEQSKILGGMKLSIPYVMINAIKN
jgi:hypothetical protein